MIVISYGQYQPNIKPVGYEQDLIRMKNDLKNICPGKRSQKLFNAYNEIKQAYSVSW